MSDSQFHIVAKSVAICISCIAIAGCATTTAPTVAPPTCVPLHTYTPAEEAALADAVAALSSGSPLIGAMVDYAAMRAADRACEATAPARNIK